MNKDEVLLHTPFLVVELGLEIDDLPAMLSTWKNLFLVGWNLEVWEKLKKRESRSTKNRAMGLSHAIAKWFWPIFMLSATAYFSAWSALFLSVVLLPTQIVAIILLFAKLYTAICIKSAFDLDEIANTS